MNYGLLVRTVRHLKLKQILFQVKNRSITPKFISTHAKRVEKLEMVEAIEKYESLAADKFTFINLTSEFKSWSDTSLGMLWAYNLNYMDWLCQSKNSFIDGAKWIDKFIEELSSNRVGLDSYPIALRGINWIKFILTNFEKVESQKLKKWNDSLFSQYILLSKKLEYHLLGNHLLEDAYSLFIASLYFNDKSFYQKASKLLREELKKQILPDGAHYEQSPMYHCILLDRLLDCCNFSFNNILFRNQKTLNNFLREKVVLMLGHLESVVYSDGTIPLLNDSAYDIAPTAKKIFEYAKRIGLEWEKISMRECGYRKMISSKFEAIVDVGDITASYQAGHSHADTFNYELRIGGNAFVVDTGISTYNKSKRRQFERGTSAHNTVSIGGKNSSEVWGGFRVANRAKVSITKDTEKKIAATHNGFGKNRIHKRVFQISGNAFSIKDIVSAKCEAVSYIHFASTVKILSYNNSEIVTDCAIIRIDGAQKVELIDGRISERYNKFLPTKIATIAFSGKLRYEISEK